MIEGSINVTTLLAVCLAAVFFILLLIIAFVIYWRNRPVPETASQIFRAILAVSAGAFGWIIGGQIALNFNVGIVAGNAAGGIALAVLIYLVNPPQRLEHQIIHNPAAPPEGPPQPVTELRQRTPTGGQSNE